MNLDIHYFAILQDEAGCSTEAFAAQANATPEQVYGALKERHGFSLGSEALTYAVNDAFVAADHSLKAGDKLVFIPPVAGG